MGLSKLQKSWEHLAKIDPMWAILSVPDKKNNKWDIKEFMKTGSLEIERVMTYLDGLSHKISKIKALDFGCGMGRLTQPLCNYFDYVTGVDISKTMINRAKELNEFNKKCQYVHNKKISLPFENEFFDFIYSNIVLQHIPSKYTIIYIEEFIRVLKKDGVLLFQLPSNLTAEYSHLGHKIIKTLKEFISNIGIVQSDKSTFDKSLPAEAYIQMHGIYIEIIKEIFEKHNLSVLEISKNDSAGIEWDSYTYCIMK